MREARSPDVELLAATTSKLIRPFEAVVLLLQATNLVMSAVNDRYRPEVVWVVLVLGLAHFLLAVLVLYRRGPLTRGHAWTFTWIALIFVVQLALAHLLAPGDFAAYGNGVPMGNYALIPLTVFAFYPWGGFRSTAMRWVIEAALVVAISLHPLVIIGLTRHWDFTPAHLRSIAQYAIWAVVWFLTGKGIAWLCRIAVRVEKDAMARSYEVTLGDFHSHVEAAARRIDAGHDAREIGRELRETTYQRRRQLLLQEDNVGAVDIVKNAIRLHGDRLRLLSSPSIGALTVPRERAIVLEQGLADLLKNVVDHGGGAVEFEFRLDGDTMVFDLRDRGPGLTPAEFAAPASTMQRLRRRLMVLGGDLSPVPSPSGTGAALRLALPLRERR
ncbi:ATP-binding protein [Nocardia sp. NRRL S-836]|uniref:ATP-binding protein n=1 Tax=Nocardia sp. NRRL S-836 TaxID=1519492 RepID=UPI000A4D119D|nr:ATP-binding protein [Nocardia sp. NRRL S-836]